MSKRRSKNRNTRKGPVPAAVKIGIAAAIAVFLVLCNFNVLGKAGGWIKDFQFGLFGVSAYIFPVLIIACVLLSVLSSSRKAAKVISAVCVYLCIGIIVHGATGGLYEETALLMYYVTGYETLSGGGLVCGLIFKGLSAAFGKVGAYVVCGLIIFVCLLIVMEFRKFLDDEKESPRSGRQKKDRSLKKDAYYDRKMEKKEARYEEVAESSKNKGMRSRYKEQKKEEKEREKEEEVFRTEEEGTVIRIVHTPSTHKMKRAETVRSQRKASSMRSGAAQKRSSAKVKGISSDLSLGNSQSVTDDVHEITRPREEEVLEAPKSQKAKSSLKVRDVTEKKEKKETSQSAAERLYGLSPSRNEKKTEAVIPLDPYGQGDLPPLSLLGKKKSRPAEGEDIEKTSRSLEYVLEQFGVYAKVVNVQTGPSVTRYEMQPEMGTRVSKFTSLADDLKLNLAVSDIRIEAPVPGKSVVGIEIPNKNVQPVTLRELLESPELTKNKSKLAFAAGRSISGDVIIGDISAMPHLLIAGTTGSGKSVFTKSIIMEILYRTTPDEVGLIIVDPKKVEFNVFEGIPHLMKSVVTDPGQAVSTLRWAVNEMMIRYDRMNKSGVNNIDSYNAKLARGQVSDAEINPQKMPRIVIVIDELADLMMVAKKEVESYICRLAQLSRAAGIHMIIATQRPSADVVTGLIKTNIPSRVALKVASGIDSRIILDCMGAEKLLGKGDMLFYPSGYSAPVRVQGAFVTDKEVSDTVDYLISHKGGSYYAEKEEEINEFINNPEQAGEDLLSGEKGNKNHYDEYFHDAGLLCIEMGRASSSMLQRRFNLGFNRAARIIDQLEEFGVIGPANGSKPREILVDSMTFEEMYKEMVKG